MGTEPTLEWQATATQSSPKSVYASASGSWTHDWGTITTGSSDEGTLLVRLTGAGEEATDMSFFVCDSGASTWTEPVPSDGWIQAGTVSSVEISMSSNATLDLVSSLTNATETILFLMTIPGGASGGTQAFDYRIKYTWA